MKKNLLVIPALAAAGAFAGAASAADLFNNGGLSTGATTGSGVAALPGCTWSECQNDGAGTANTSSGSTVSVSGTADFHLADDFTVPAGGWTIREASFFCYQTAAGGPVVDTVHVKIWNGAPNAGGTVIFGDDTTNRYSNQLPANLIRAFSTTVPAVAVPSQQRGVYEVRAKIETAPGVGLALTPGTYWIEWHFAAVPGITAAAVFNPAVTVVGARNRPTDNALQLTLPAATWAAVLDTGNPAAGPDVPLDFPFILRDVPAPIGGGSTCEGDTDGNGVVNVDDLVNVILGWGACP